MTSLLTAVIAVYFIDIHVISQETLGYTSPIITQIMEILVQLVILSKTTFSELMITWVKYWPL